MKVGYHLVIRLAWKAFAFAQALYKSCFLLNVWLLLVFQNILTASPVTTDMGIVVPFRLIGNTMIVEATINGQPGDFLFDTGAPDLILNSAHFAGFSEPSDYPEVVGLYGDVLSVQQYMAKEIAFSGKVVGKGLAMVLDLTALEKVKKQPIAGILGYSVFKNYELKIDFFCQQIHLALLKKREKYTVQTPDSPADSFDFKMSGHIPYINVKLGEKNLRMGIDFGSERNVLQKEMVDMQHFEVKGNLLLAGLTHQVQRQPIGMLSGFAIGNLGIDALEVVLTDFERASSELPVQLQGILGVAFFKQYKVAINYQRKKIYFWLRASQQEEGQLAVCKP